MKGRHYGIDLLRLIAMFFIVATHVVSHGGILVQAKGLNSVVSWMILFIGITCLNSYALISGYVGYREEEKPYRYSKFISIWLPVLFYSVVIAGICCSLQVVDDPDEQMLKAWMPTIRCSYWYFTAYVPVFFAVPYLNKCFRNLTEREMTKLAVTILVLFSLLATLAATFSEIFNMNQGLSFVWIFMLYIVGAWIKKCGICQKVRTVYLWGGLILCILASLGIHATPFAGWLLLYYFPPYTIGAVLLVCIFSRIHPAGIPQKAIALFGPAAFGVYLIHAHPIIDINILYQALTEWAADAPALLWTKVIGLTLAVFFGCLVIECIRIRLFRLCRIDALVNRVQEKLSSIGQKHAETTRQ